MTSTLTTDVPGLPSIRNIDAADPPHYGQLAVRTLTAVLCGTLLYATDVTDLALVLLVVISILAIDLRNVLSFKNFLLLYILVVFGIGGAVLHLTDQPVYSDVVAYTLAFLGGYSLASMPTVSRRSTGDQIRRPRGKGAFDLVVVEHALLGLIGLELLYLAFQFLKYGVVGYYQGAGLLNTALTYGKASATGGALQIVSFGLTYSAVGLVVLYVQACFETATPIRYRYPAALFVVLPILSLSRFNAVIGAFTLLAVHACDRRLTAWRVSQGSIRLIAPPKVSRAAIIVLGIILAIAMGAFVASIRGGFANKTGGVSSSPDRVAMFTSELSPVQAYGDIRANTNLLGRTHGRTIILPLLLKVVPRAWYPNKPLNSGSFYMSKVRPAEWAAGYALPPTLWGDLYLSFGFLGAVAGSLLLGVVVARLDIGYRQGVVTKLASFLLVFANFYALMRDPLSESLAGILLTILIWAIANRAFRFSTASVTHPATIGH